MQVVAETLKLAPMHVPAAAIVVAFSVRRKSCEDIATVEIVTSVSLVATVDRH